jgi:hypothetical protein
MIALKESVLVVSVAVVLYIVISCWLSIVSCVKSISYEEVLKEIIINKNKINNNDKYDE